jgi:hypothetical protein
MDDYFEDVAIAEELKKKELGEDASDTATVAPVSVRKPSASKKQHILD